jgi:choline dehydrogenase-like flavoprotein
MNLNLRARGQNTYDVIVVGSGISGGWAAKELCESGLKVLMVERGKSLEHPNYPTATKSPWDFPHRSRLLREDYERCPVQSRHWSFRHDNKDYHINDLENPYHEINRFDWIRSDVVGGRSVLWGRQCLRLSDVDFEANGKDGHGVDWPVRYKDIAPWYDYVEKFIGVSGIPEGLAHFPDGIFQPPMEMNCGEKAFKERVEARFPERRITIGRTANLTAPVKGRGICQYRNLCHRGCPYGAYFSTNASTLPAAFETGNLTLMPNSLVNEVLYDEEMQRANGVQVINTESGEVSEYYARIIFLNASTVATAFILLNSKSQRFPNGLGNDSDQVGRNLMDHHKFMGASATLEGMEDQYYTGRKPVGLHIPRFRNIFDKHQHFIRGYGFQGEAYRAGWQRNSYDLIGLELKASLSEPGPWRISFTGFGECLPYSNNRVTLNTDIKDKWGRNTVAIDCKFKENEHAMQKDIGITIGEMLEAAGGKEINVQGRMSFPGNSNHEMGTVRMGRDPKTSVLNGVNQMHDVKNVFVTDGSFMCSSSSVNPSLTYMAFTARAARYAVESLKRGDL